MVIVLQYRVLKFHHSNLAGIYKYFIGNLSFPSNTHFISLMAS